MIIVGLTGGIGSGKSTLAKVLEQEGVPVYLADSKSKELLKHPEIRRQIVETFGDGVLQQGEVSTSRLASEVFSDPSKLEKLNSIMHPAVRRDFYYWLEQNNKAPLVVKEAAILFESGAAEDCDYIITVSAPVEDRISRVINRDNTTREAVLNRMSKQWTDQMREEKSDFVIHNTNLSLARAEVKKILKKMRYLQNSK
jgi:dephospho-CoA kinase